MAALPLKQLAWSHLYAAIYKCFSPSDSGREKVWEELEIADAKDIVASSDLTRVLGRLQGELIAKRLYNYAANPTSRLLVFRTGMRKRGNKQHLDSLRRAQSKEEVRRSAGALAQHYVTVPNIREGVLIFLVSSAHGAGLSESCLFVFKCDFEQISRITQRSLFEQVEDAIVEKTKKAALYPYFESGRFDDGTVRVFDELGETQYWLDFLELGERKEEFKSTQQATEEVLAEEFPEIRQLIAKPVLEGLPAVRSLEEGETLVRERLDTRAAQEVSQKVADKAGDPKVTLRLGGVTVTAPIRGFGRSWITVAEGDRRYILVKGDKIENRTRMLTPVDFTAPESSLEEAKRLLDSEAQ